MSQPNTKPRTGKADRPRKPRPDFPLFPHATGRWAKKIRGKFQFFGKVATDPEGKAALDLWLDQKDDLLAGRAPRAYNAAGARVVDLVNHFLTHKRGLLDAGEIIPRTFAQYHDTCSRLIETFGRGSPIDTIVAEDFQRLRAGIAKRLGPVALANEIQRVRSVFKYAFEAGLTDTPPRFGPGFKKPSAKVLRKVRAARGLRMFEREELLGVLAAATPLLKAMILLGVNAGMGNNDCALLPMSGIDLKRGWLVFARPKTGIERRVPLWPETIHALKAVIGRRRKPKDSTHESLVFIGPRGESFISKNGGYRVANPMIRLLKKAKIARKGLSFYSLRHTFQTVAEGARDLAAVQAIMGHAPAATDMSATYRERIDDARLLAVVNHVHDWLDPTVAKKAKAK